MSGIISSAVSDAVASVAARVGVWPGQQPAPEPPGEQAGGSAVPQLPTVVPRPLPGRAGEAAEYISGMFFTVAGYGVFILLFAGVATITIGKAFNNRVAGSLGIGMVLGSLACGLIWGAGRDWISMFATGDFAR